MSEKPQARNDRVAIEPDMHEVYKALTEGSDPEQVPFDEFKDVFVVAACLGYVRGKKRPLSDRRDIVRWETLSRETDVPLLHALAVAETHDVKVLEQGYEYLTLAEEYANEGIRVLKQALLDQPGRPLWNLVSLIEDNLPATRQSQEQSA